MKKLLALVLCFSLFLGLTACIKTEEDPTEPPTADPTVPSTPNSPEKPPVYRMDTFDGELIEYLCLNGYEYTSFTVSPTALRASLCLAAAGAQGNTRSELLGVAGFSTMDSLNAWYAKLQSAGAPASSGFTLGNSVWNDLDLMGEFSDSFKKRVQSDYNAEAYSRKSDALQQGINDWIRKKTDGSILEIAKDVDGVSSLLLNTLHLQAAWETLFSDAALRQGTYIDFDGETKPLDFMEQTLQCLYAEDGSMQVLAIPLEGDLYFVCFLGNRTDRFDKMAELQPATVHVVLPKFSIASAFDSRDLLGFLLRRGINDALNGTTANFYNMCQDSDWFIQEIIQETAFRLGENGVGSAPEKTARETPETGEVPDISDIREFIADSPFSFGIFSDFGTGSQHMLLYGQLMISD